MRSWIWVVLVGSCSLLVPVVGASDFQLEYRDDGYEDGWEFSSDAEVSAEAVESQEGRRYAWNLGSQESRLIGEIRVPAGLFEVQRVRQVVPMVDNGLFFEVREKSVDEAEGAARVVNVTRSEDGGFVYRLAFPFEEGSDEALLTLTKDEEPPGFVIGPVQNITHNSFYVETETDEPAWGDLWVERADVSEPSAVLHQTNTPSVLQRFPVRGLQPESNYTFHVEFRDWAQNTVESGWVNFTTTARELGSPPRILQVAPTPDAVLSGPPEAIEAEVDPVEGEILSTGVRLFVDLEEVSPGVLLGPDTIRYVPPEPLDVGDHVVRLELTNSVGGEAERRWGFEVVDGDPDEAAPGSSVLLWAAGILGVLGVLRARRRDS